MKNNKLSYRAAVRRARVRGYFLADRTDHPTRKWPEGKHKNYYLASLTKNSPGKYFNSIREAMDHVDSLVGRIKQPDLYHSTSILSPFHP